MPPEHCSNTPKKSSIVTDDNESEGESNTVKPKFSVERLSMSQLNSKSIDNNSSTINRNLVKVPSHIYTRRSPDSQKNLRAKTVRIGKIRWPPPLNPEDTDNGNQHRRMLVQRRIQEEIHGNKTTNTCLESPPVIDQPIIIHTQQTQSEDKCSDQLKKSSVNNTFNDRLSPSTIDDDMSTNELVTRNQSSKLELHKTLTPMIGKENFELRKKLFEHPDSDSPFTDVIPNLNDQIRSRKTSPDYLTYRNLPWKLKLRKEIFSPKETFEQPILIDLLYLQIVFDTFSSYCIRISEAERTNMKTFLSSHGVASCDDVNLITKLSAKKAIIEQARQWPNYFSRFFPVSIPKIHSGETQMLGVSHSGIRLLKRTRTKTHEDVLQVLETVRFDNIQQISSIRNSSTIDLRLIKKKLLTIHSHRIQKIKQLIEKFFKESHSVPLKKTLSPNLNSNTSDLFKSSSQASFMSCSQTFSELIPSISNDNHTPKPTQNQRTISALPNGYSMMEFALQNYKVPHRRRSKKGWKTSEWTWQDYSVLLKWSKQPIQSPLLRQSSNDVSRLARQCFLTIMRFMGDHALARGQTEIDCLLYLLKNLHKHRSLIDEVLCQLIKQLTENQSTKIDSAQRGWKLLVMILNYFIPTEHLRPFFVKYLNDNIHQNEKFVQLCLHHYEQTLKYGGRKNAPSKAEIDLLTANGRNGGKRQTFLLPGGTPLTLLTTPSMVVSDCLNLLCERLNITNNFEHDEYSIFIISPSDQSSRLLNSTEYLFDILSECIRSNVTDYHLIIKRMLWFTNSMISKEKIHQSEIFIDFMYYQLVPEFLEGILIVLLNNHFSDELMQQISYMAALQYRASNRIGLPSMREVKHLLPITVLKLKSVRPQIWTTTVHEQIESSVEKLTPIEAKFKFINLIQTWPLFGTTFFPVQSVDHPSIQSPCLIGINKNGLLFLDIDTRETLFSIPYNDVVSIRRHQSAIDIKYGSLNQPHILQCHIERSQDLVALTGRYLSFIGRSLSSALGRKTTSEHSYRPITASPYNDPISTIL